MSAEVHYSASDSVQHVLARLGRTEDVKFSPSQRRLAVAGFHANRIALIDVDIRSSAGRKTVDLSGAVEIEAPTIIAPHGLCFVDEDTLVVASRGGSVDVFSIRDRNGGSNRAATARQTIAGGPAGRVHTPGSVAAVAGADGTTELLVCNNYANTVTRHVLDHRAGFAPRREDLLLRRRLDVPDGICVSPDSRWIAVSNHNTHSVLLYERGPRLHAESLPDGVLRNVLCPHGVRFTPDQEHILVADAGARYVNVYRKDAPTWKGTREPVRLFPVMSEGLFLSGRHNPEEGGPKGIDISEATNVLVTTSEFQTLAFFDVDEIVGLADAPANRLRRYLQWRVTRAVFKRIGHMPGAPA